MHKYKVTNDSKAAVFLTEAGRLLRPGESTTVARVDAGTRKDKRLKITEGEFTPPAPQIKTPKKVVDDDDEQVVTKATLKDDSPATLVDNHPSRRSVPLVAPGATDENQPGADDHEKTAGATDGGEDDELDGLVAKAEKPAAEKGDSAGFHIQKGLVTDDDKKTDDKGEAGR